jgi:ABC-type transport system involved in cytochrome c biogenesis permease subunit
VPIDPVVEYYSDLAYGTALVLYLLAMVLHAVEYSVTRVPVTTAAGRVAAEGNGAVATLAPPDSTSMRGTPERVGRSAVALTGLAVLVHASSLALRGAAIGRVPWANMYEFTSAICCVAVACWLVALYRQGSAATSLRNSYWITIHVSAAITATGILLVSGVASALYLVGAPAGSRIAARLPDSTILDRVAYRTAVVAFPIWTFAIIAGAIWAEAAWGHYWGWDPKETCALVAWVVYAGYLHARATAGWRGSPAAWINVVGFAVMLFNLFFVNIVVAGLHSYAGL